MLKVHVKNLENEVVLSLEGRVVTGETEILRYAVRSQPTCTATTLDLAEVTTIDAHGLGVLLELRDQSLRKGSRFRLMNVSPQLNQVFEITRLNTVFEMTSKVEYLPWVSCARQRPVAALLVRLTISGGSFQSSSVIGDLTFLICHFFAMGLTKFFGDSTTSIRNVKWKLSNPPNDSW